MTLYQDVYDIFLNKVTEYSFLNLSDEDLESIFGVYFKNAISKFKNCKQDLKDRDDLMMTFYIDLTDEEIDIIATLMLNEWLKPKIYNIELIKQNVSNKDFQFTSQANHLKELKGLEKDLKTEISQMKSSYSYNIENFKKL